MHFHQFGYAIKNRLGPVFIATLLASCFGGGPVLAQTATGITLGLEGYYYKYQESVSDTGFMDYYGGFGAISAGYTYAYKNYFVGVSGKLGRGYVDYSSRNSGTSNTSVAEDVMEGRLEVGHDVPFAVNCWFTPAIGLGYRQLYDHSSGTHTSIGDWGYDRKSEYYFLPISGALTVPWEDGWNIRPKLTYDYFIKGYQTSYMSENSYYQDLHNSQAGGYGVEFELPLTKTKNGRTVQFGPFVRYWNIDRSDVQPLICGSGTCGNAYEPPNETIETGLKASVIF